MSSTNTPSTNLCAALGAFLVMATLWTHTLTAPAAQAATPPVSVIALPLAA